MLRSGCLLVARRRRATRREDSTTFGGIAEVHREIEMNPPSRRDRTPARPVDPVAATSPRYAQIRHGPIEYGKDIAALADDGEVSVLCLYQVRVRGDEYAEMAEGSRRA